MRYRHVLPAIALALPALLAAQPSHLDLTVNNVGIAIGDAPRVTGLRISFRDRYLERVDGVNHGVDAYEVSGEVRGIAVAGLTIAGVGAGAGEGVDGITIAGVGVGAPSSPGS